MKFIKAVSSSSNPLFQILLSTAVLTISLVMVLAGVSNRPDHDWPVTGGSKHNLRYSPLKQIDTANVGNLQMAWTYASEGGDFTKVGTIQCNPIVVNKVLYGVSPRMKVFALDAASGKEIWKFDPADSLQNKS